MRMRTKKWALPELLACNFFVADAKKQRGRWQECFSRPQTLWLELGCGKGGFAAQMALSHPACNFLAVDSQTDMLGTARRKAADAYGRARRPVDNLVLAVGEITHISDFLAPEDTVDRIFINFANPWPKAGHKQRRLTHTRQLLQYRAFLRDGGEIWFKTDDDGLFNQSLPYFAEAGFAVRYRTADLSAVDLVAEGVAEEQSLPTEHEEMYRAEGRKIKFLIAVKQPLAEDE